MPARRVGDWDKCESLIHNLGRECVDAKNTSLKRFGLKAEAIAVGHISKQDLGWKALSPAYLAKKIREGFSENILVRSSSYFQAITSWLPPDGVSVYIGVTKDAKNKEGQILADIAAVHEYGSTTAKIPARPLWQPTYKEVIAWHKAHNNPAVIFSQAIKRKYGV